MNNPGVDEIVVPEQILGIDYENVTLPDGTGRPVHIVQNGQTIPELIGTRLTETT